MRPPSTDLPLPVSVAASCRRRVLAHPRRAPDSATSQASDGSGTHISHPDDRTHYNALLAVRCLQKHAQPPQPTTTAGLADAAQPAKWKLGRHWIQRDRRTHSPVCLQQHAPAAPGQQVCLDSSPPNPAAASQPRQPDTTRPPLSPLLILRFHSLHLWLVQPLVGWATRSCQR